MNFVMKKSESKISDRHYLMDIPVGALVIAPDEFFTRFGKTFSNPKREELSNDLKRNSVYHAIPSDTKRKPVTPYIVRQIHSSLVKDALAGKLAKEMLSPKDHIDDLMKAAAGNDDNDKKAETVNVFSLTLPQLKALAAEHKIAVTKKTTREELTKLLAAKLAEVKA